MIGKSFKGNGFYGTYRYLLETGEPSPQKHAHIIGGNMAGRTAQELSSEVRPSRQLRPDIRKPMWHVSLSFRPGETVTDALMQQASDRFLDEMGLERDQHQHLYIRHHDRPHPHVHLVVNRIRDDIGQDHYSGARYHTQRQQQRLILSRRQSQETLLDATWNPQQQNWQPNQAGRLTESDLSHLRRSAQTLQEEEQRQRQQRQRQLTREPELEL